MMRFFALALGAMLFASPAFADADATIKYRQNSMKAIGSQLGSIAAILKGDIKNTEALATHAATLAALSDMQITVPAFLENTDGQGSTKTTSTAKIWEDWGGFMMGLWELQQASKAAAAAGANISFDHVKALGATCKSCHTAFREKK